MNQEEMRNEFNILYNIMANSHDVTYMRTFGNVHKKMMEWMIQNKPSDAQEWIWKLESIRWRNYLTPNEAQAIVDKMDPKAPWTRDQWKAAMEQHGFALENDPYYNSCALWVTMCMKVSDSGNTLSKYIDGQKMFQAVHDLAVDSLQDKDRRFNIRTYFGV